MKKLPLHLILMLLAPHLFGQIKLENKQTAEFYVKNVLLGPGVKVGKVKHIGKIGGIGQFQADAALIGVSSGIILSTGNTDSINGPNDASSYTSSGSFPKSKRKQRLIKRGDRDLNKLARRRVRDIQVIEFDFVPVKNKLEFNFVFASEEYREYATSRYNDVFAFFLSGPNIKKRINLATLPNGTTPVSINTINHIRNRKYYRENGGSRKRLKHRIKKWYFRKFQTKDFKNKRFENSLMNRIQFDGLTTVLKAQYDVIPNKKYHIKLAIGDGSDFAYDSAVMIEAGSFVSVRDSLGAHFQTLLEQEHKEVDYDKILKIKPTPPTNGNTQKTTASDSFHFRIRNIYFEHDSYLVPEMDTAMLDSLATVLNLQDSLECFITGYTDNSGSVTYNQKLSEKRAKAIVAYLVSKGISLGRLEYEGLNFQNPDNDNATADKRAKNRRVEIRVE